MSKQLTRQGPFWTITEVFEDQKSSRRLHQGHWSLSFMSLHSSRRLPLLIVRHTLPESGAASRGMRAGATTVSRGSLAPRSPASPCFFSVRNHSPITLLCSCLELDYNCRHSSNDFGPLPKPLPPPTGVEVKPNICCQVSAEIRTTSGWPILKNCINCLETVAW